ncbi:MAG: thiamine phosphate synthase [Pseudomonadota bacterium]
MSTSSLYVLTPPSIDDLDAFASSLEAVLDAGKGTAAVAACIQLRLKDVPDTDVLEAARRLIPICHQRDVGFLVNDRPDLAKQAGADGVHIGQTDTALEEARDILGADKDIGVTCHDSIHLAMEAGEGGADYVAFGAFYPTATKTTEHRADTTILSRWSEMATVPSVAIGGITPSNAAPLSVAGADYLAVCGSIWHHPDGPVKAVEAFANALEAA